MKGALSSKTKGLKSPLFYILPVVMCLLLSCSQAKLSVARGQSLHGEYHAASETYRQLYSGTPREERELRGVIAFEMAENYRRLNQSARAVTAYANAIRYDYPDTLMFLHHAQMLHREGKYRDAEEAYKRYLVMSPAHPAALNGLRGVELATCWQDNPTRHSVQRKALFNSNRAEFSPMLSHEGDRLYFTSSRENALGEERSKVTGMKYNDLFYSVKNVHGEWQRPTQITSGLNGEYDEGTPSFSSDGEWMYYTHSYPDWERPTTANIFLSRWVNGRWTAGIPLRMVEGDSLSLFAHPAISPDGRWLYFVSDMAGGYGGKDIWRAAMRSPHEVVSLENLGPDVNTAGDELFPFLRNHNTLYFSSDGHPGMGGLDLFVAVEQSVATDANHMKVTANTPESKVNESERTQISWRVANLQYPLNSSADDFGITFEPKGESGFLSSNRADVRGYDHLYEFTFHPIVTKIAGVAEDADKIPVAGAAVLVVGSDGLQLELQTTSQGTFYFDGNTDVSYLLMASAKGFLNQRRKVTTLPINRDSLYHVGFEMIPYGRPVELENIYYDFDRASLRPESKTSLQGLIDLLHEHPLIAVKLAAHTDRKGDEDYNLDLSLRRAQSVLEYLVENGIKESRLSVVGFGESQPATVTKKWADQFNFLEVGDVLTDEYIENLPPEKQEISDQINRRTSFEVTELASGLY